MRKTRHRWIKLKSNSVSFLLSKMSEICNIFRKKWGLYDKICKICGLFCSKWGKYDLTSKKVRNNLQNWLETEVLLPWSGNSFFCSIYAQYHFGVFKIFWLILFQYFNSISSQGLLLAKFAQNFRKIWKTWGNLGKNQANICK